MMSSTSYMGMDAGDILEVYRTFEPDNPLYCRIMDVSDEWITADRRSKDGEQFGVTILKLESVWKIRFDTNRARQIFSRDSGLKLQTAPVGSLTPEYLKETEALYGCITLYCENLDLDVVAIGTILEIRDDVVFIQEFRPLATPERNICGILLQEITRVEAGGEYERRLLDSYKVLP